MTMQFKSFKAAPIKENEVEGLASTYGNIDHAGDVVEPGAYTRTIDAFNRRKSGMPFLAHHRHDRPIGRIVELQDTVEGLWFRAAFSKSHDGQNVREQFLDGTLDSFSIGYRVLQKQVDRVGEQKVLRLKEISLHEISAVTFACNEMAKVAAVKGTISETYSELSLEDQQRVADFAAKLLAKQSGTELDIAADDMVEEAVKALEVEQKAVLQSAFEDAMLAYRIKQKFNR